MAQRADYEGPTILSRGVETVLQGGGELLRLRPYVSLTGVYDTAMTPVSVDSTGKIPQTNNYGEELGLGVYGYHRWQHSVLGIDNRGNVRHYGKNSYYDGSDHGLSLALTHQPTRRLAFTLREAAGTYSRSYGFSGAYQYVDPAFADVPSNELFDGRTDYASTMADLTFSKNQRLSFNIGGSGMIVRRRSKVLIGTNSWSARGDLAYRVSRRFTVGVDYGFTHYAFTKGFGASDIHTASGDLSFQLSRLWNLGLRAGGARVETLGLRRFAIAPILAAILGQDSILLVMHRRNYVPNIEAKLSRVFRRSNLSFGYGITVDPGNGLYLTSKSQNAVLNYSHTASERWNFGVSGSHGTYSSLSQDLGKYTNYSAGAGVTCRLKSWLHLVARYDARRYEVEGADFRRIAQRASLGLAFSPGELPLSLF